MARKFLTVMAVLIVLVIVALIVLRIWSRELTEFAFVPSSEFVEQQPFDENAYNDPDMWFSRPGIGLDDPARWQPAMRGEERTIPSPTNPKPKNFAVFFVHPTSYYPVAMRDEIKWNAPLEDAETNDRSRLFLRGLASAFNEASEIWAPRYRQATVGAFLTDAPQAQQSIDAAYKDVKQAFDFFIGSVDEETPIVLAGHSQGALHLITLLQSEAAGTPLADRIAAVYAVGWPISVEHDLPALGLPPCATANQSGCIVSWSSYAEPADPGDMLETYAKSEGFDGTRRGDSTILCVNPLTGTFGGEATAEANRGTLVPDGDLANGELVAGAVPARCDDRGLLLIGDPPRMGSYVLPGNNYHVYDIPLFWKNTQDDVARRVEAWSASR